MLKVKKSKNRLNTLEEVRNALFYGFVVCKETSVERKYSKSLLKRLQNHFGRFFDVWDESQNYVLICDSDNLSNMGYSESLITDNVTIPCKIVDGFKFDEICNQFVSMYKIEYDKEKDEEFAVDKEFIYISAGAGLRLLLVQEALL